MVLLNHTAAVSNVRVESLSSAAVRVSWETIDLPGVIGYRIFYSQTEENSKRQSQGESMVDVPASENVVNVSGLLSSVDYQFQVVALAELEGVEVLGSRAVTVRTLLPSTPSPMICDGDV